MPLSLHPRHCLLQIPPPRADQNYGETAFLAGALEETLRPMTLHADNLDLATGQLLGTSAILAGIYPSLPYRAESVCSRSHSYVSRKPIFKKLEKHGLADPFPSAVSAYISTYGL